MEWKQVLYNKKFIFWIILLICANCILFAREQFAYDSPEQLFIKKEIRQEYYNKIEGRNNTDILSYIRNEWNNEKESQQEVSIKEEVLYEMLKDSEYISNYPDYLEQINKRAKQMKKTSIFNQENTFSSMNIDKTLKDYSNLQDISLSFGNNLPISSIVFNNTIHYINIISIFLLLFFIRSDHNRGLLILLNSTKHGRSSLFYKRILILLIGSLILTIINYGSIFFISTQLYGNDIIFSREIQSIPAFCDITYRLDIGQFVFYYISINILYNFLIVLFLWFILSMIKNITVSILTLGIFCGIEYLSYRFIPAQSNWNEFKYLNIFY